MVIWIIGLSGSGKSTLGHKIFKKVKRFKDNIIIIDGDEFRKVMNNDRIHALGWQHSTDLRKGLHQAYHWFLENQGVARG